MVVLQFLFFLKFDVLYCVLHGAKKQCQIVLKIETIILSTHFHILTNQPTLLYSTVYTVQSAHPTVLYICTVQRQHQVKHAPGGAKTFQLHFLLLSLLKIILYKIGSLYLITFAQDILIKISKSFYLFSQFFKDSCKFICLGI